jgi:hypothetical protein
MASFECGPSGGSGGNWFGDGVPADGVGVSQILVWHGDYIDAIQLKFSDGTMTPKHGGSGGNLTTFALGPGEFISMLSGRYGSYIDSLTISTNVKNFPAIGGNGGSQDYIYGAFTNAEVIGFIGASGSYMDALGIVARSRLAI